MYDWPRSNLKCGYAHKIKKSFSDCPSYPPSPHHYRGSHNFSGEWESKCYAYNGNGSGSKMVRICPAASHFRMTDKKKTTTSISSLCTHQQSRSCPGRQHFLPACEVWTLEAVLSTCPPWGHIYKVKTAMSRLHHNVQIMNLHTDKSSPLDAVIFDKWDTTEISQSWSQKKGGLCWWVSVTDHPSLKHLPSYLHPR